MKRTFESEDDRKNKLFKSWITYLNGIHKEMSGSFDEIYEGLAHISDLSKNWLGVHLEDGRKLRHIPVAPEISELSAPLDLVYLVLGRKNDDWWPLDVISIGSMIDSKSDRFHMTVNPLLMPKTHPVMAH